MAAVGIAALVVLALLCLAPLVVAAIVAIVLLATGRRTVRCPYCAERIQEKAVVCRYCGHDLSTGEAEVVHGDQ